MIDSVSSTGQDLNASGHFAADKIRKLKANLQDTWANLQEATVQRSRVLQESLEAQQYYARVSEAESWMNDREPLAAQEEYGKDEDATQVC